MAKTTKEQRERWRDFAQRNKAGGFDFKPCWPRLEALEQLLDDANALAQAERERDEQSDIAQAYIDRMIAAERERDAALAKLAQLQRACATVLDAVDEDDLRAALEASKGEK